MAKTPRKTETYRAARRAAWKETGEFTRLDGQHKETHRTATHWLRHPIVHANKRWREGDKVREPTVIVPYDTPLPSSAAVNAMMGETTEVFEYNS